MHNFFLHFHGFIEKKMAIIRFTHLGQNLYGLDS